jgi:hypothetical protein
MNTNRSGSRPTRLFLVIWLCLTLAFSMLAAGITLLRASGASAAHAVIPGTSTQANSLGPNLPSTSIVISQIYGGGGNSGAPWHNDFIELFNRSSAPVDITGWSVQYASATGASWQVSGPLAGTIPPGGYFLVQEAAGSGGGEPLPTPDFTGNIAMSSTAAKIALVNNSTALSCGTSTNRCLPNPTIIDYVGYGATATDWEGSGAAPAPSNSSSIERLSVGCTDTDNNATDFAAMTTITPRNSASPSKAVRPQIPTPQADPPTLAPTRHCRPEPYPPMRAFTFTCCTIRSTTLAQWELAMKACA